MLFHVYLLVALCAALLSFVFLRGIKLWGAALLFVGVLLGLLLVHLIVLVVASLFVNKDEPAEKAFGFYKKLMTASIGAFLALGGVRYTLEGEEKLPRTGGFLLVCNHRSMFDPMISMHALQSRGLVFITKKENISIPVGGPLMLGMGCPSLDRGSARQAIGLMKDTARRMEQGEAMGVYPEGTRSKTGLLGSFKPGAFKCALWAKVPVVVATVEGTENIHRRFFFRRPTKVQMRILETIPYETLSAMDTAAIAHMTRDCMLEKGGLLGA